MASNVSIDLSNPTAWQAQQPKRAPQASLAFFSVADHTHSPVAAL
ncbi:hypothetical protein OFC04_24385 [Escherichia coli]|nr:hypothetical protein [Escherichia coli]